MNNNNRFVLPEELCSSMAMPKHSKKLELALRNYITSMDGHYYDDELSKGILASYFRLDNGICVEQKVQVRQTDYVCYTTLSVHAKPDNSHRILRYIRIANDINMELDFGNFEIDTKTGDIRFRTYYEPIDIVRMEAFDKLLGYPSYTINKYGHFFTDVV